MRSGKISEAVLKRSVLKEIHTKNEMVIEGAGVGEDAAVLKADGEIVTATTTVTLGENTPAMTGIYRVMADLACKGAGIEAVMMNVIMPERFDERILKNIMRQSQMLCKKYGIQIAGGHTEATGAAKVPIVCYTGIGRRKYTVSGIIRPGDKIYLTKWIGLEGGYQLYMMKKEELEKRFPKNFFDLFDRIPMMYDITEEADIACKNGASYLHNLSNGGIMNALWELSVKGKCGIKVDFKKIPVKQEIIEVCEYFDLNPYRMLSGGSLLMTAPPECDIVNVLNEHDIPAALIGEVTDNNDKIIMNEDEVRYLDTPGRDELWKIIDGEA